MALLDRHKRPLRNLRLSVTDRCNLRCAYCMPEEEYVWFPHEQILQFEEIDRLVGVFTSLGVDRVRLTGGEPLLRRELPVLISLLASRAEIADLALTTNAVRLADMAADLAAAGLHRLTVSLDTLRADRFTKLTRRDDLARVLGGIDAAVATGLREGLKIDTVVMRGVNDDELVDLLEFGRDVGAEVRFIEYMDVGGATNWTPLAVVTRAEMLAALTREFGEITPIVEDSSAPAARFRLPDGRIFGIISSTSQPFCGSCDRSRLTADGRWFLCLYARDGFDLKTMLRDGARDDEISARIAALWNARTDRGAEDRLALEDRASFARPDELKGDPWLEMHTRGG